MRTVPAAWATLETARERSVALLVHIWAVPGGRASWAAGAWGSWTYSIGFQGNVNFTDVADYARDWSANSGNPITRTYVPAAIEFDASQIFRSESTTLDPHDVTLQVDPQLDPFATYVNRFWPVKFGITIYKVHRNGNAVATVDNGFSVQVPVVDVLFVGYLHADDTLEHNSAGLQLDITAAAADAGAKAKLTTQWDHVTKVLDRLVPRPVFSIDCPKMVYSTGNGAAVDCNADLPSNLVTDTALQISGTRVSGLAWGTQDDSFFTQGLLVYTATDPSSGVDFTFTLNIQSSAQRVDGGNTYGDLYLEMFPPLLSIGTVCNAYRGCDRSRESCKTKFIPAGTSPAPSGAFTPGTLRVSLELFSTVNPTQQPKAAHVYITATQVWIVYGRGNTNQIGNIDLGPGTGNAWNPTWIAQGSSIITSPKYTLASASPALAGPPAQDGYHIALANNGATASIEQQPAAANGYVTIIKCPGGSAATFDFTIAWVANVNNVSASGFGDPTYDGDYRANGYFNGNTLYVNNSGAVLFFHSHGNWVLAGGITEPFASVAYYLNAAASSPFDPAYQPWTAQAGFGATPGGMVVNAPVVVALGNLENFGGTDIPIEHPSLETAR